jgi:hypothetical protein
MYDQLIIKNKDIIIEKAIEWMKEKHPSRTSNYYKCARDLHHILNAYATDLKENTNVTIEFIGETFWQNGKRHLTDYKVELAVQDFIINYIEQNISSDQNFINKLVELKNKLNFIVEFGTKKSIKNVLEKRKHVYAYKDDDIPSYETIKGIFLRSWQITPSKQNIMPYKVNILGPNARETKEKIYDLVVGNHYRMDDEGLKEGTITKVTRKENPHYRHVLHNPYLVVFSQRVCTEKDINLFYKRVIKDEGHFMEQASKKWVEHIKASTSIEVGLFAQNVAALCLEQDLDYSFTACFPGPAKDWHEIKFVEHDVLLLMSIGKGKIYRRNFIAEITSDHDYKTAFENVVQFEK